MRMWASFLYRFFFGLLLWSPLDSSSLCLADHRYLLSGRGLGGKVVQGKPRQGKTLPRSVRVSGVQGFFSIQESFDRTTNYLDEDEYTQTHLVWIQSPIYAPGNPSGNSCNASGSSKFAQRTAQRRSGFFANLIQLSRDASGQIFVHFHLIDTDEHYSIHSIFEAELVEGNWQEVISHGPFLLRLTSQSQERFNEFLRERFEHTWLRRLRTLERSKLLKKGWVIQSIEELSTFTRFNSSAPVRTGLTYWVGSSTGILATYPDLELRYRLRLCPSSRPCEMNWRSLGRKYYAVKHLEVVEQ